MEPEAELFDGIVAVLLEGVDVAGEAAEGGDRASEFFRVGGQGFLGLGLEEELREISGRELQADFGQAGGVVFAQVLEQIGPGLRSLEVRDLSGLELSVHSGAGSDGLMD